jgi:hypothetical protein
VLAHWNNSPRWDMSLHADTLFWFRASQSSPLFLLNGVCLAEEQPIVKSLVWSARGSNPRGEHANHYAIDAVENKMAKKKRNNKSKWSTNHYSKKLLIEQYKPQSKNEMNSIDELITFFSYWFCKQSTTVYWYKLTHRFM